jgi:3-isopropylmalate/(R)-2-methylmalate dehydratase small subunit
MIVGRVWKFGDSINTDLMLPGHAALLPPAEQARLVFQANRPGWVDQVVKGDIVVAGKSFGLGSSRPAARSLRNLGIGCVIAESLARLFFRNAVNWGLVALECPGIEAAFEEGQAAEISTDDWTVCNKATGRELRLVPIPDMLLELMQGGGIYPVLERDGLVAPAQANAGRK